MRRCLCGGVVAFLLMVATVAAAQPKDILFVTSQGLAQINPDGTGLTLLNLQGKAPRWSPDGTKFAFLKLTGGFQFTLFVADADGSNVRTLNANVGWTTYQWSPDATQIAFLSNGDPSTGFELFVVNADGTNLRSLGVRVGVGISDFGNPFVWTPDGSQILFVAPSGQLSYVRVSDGAVTNLPVRGAGLAYHPSGSFFVFTSQRSNNSPLELFVASPDGATVRPLNLQGTNPILSPNGQFLLFFSSSSQPQAFVVELSPTGAPVGDPVPLNVSNLSVSGSFEPWSPDSTRLVLPTESGLFVVRRDGTGLTPLNASGFDPQWRPLPRLQLTV
ncbi:MAG: hypothetical protein XFASWVDF_002117, partial [Candidatus Fervidibacter sp.]